MILFGLLCFLILISVLFYGLFVVDYDKFTRLVATIVFGIPAIYILITLFK